MGERVEVSPGLFAERTATDNLRVTRVDEDGSERSANLYVFDRKLVEELRSHIVVAQESERQMRRRHRHPLIAIARWCAWLGRKVLSLLPPWKRSS